VPHLEAILTDAAGSAIITVEEAPTEAGWGAEMIASIERLRDAHGLGAIAYARVGAKNTPIPSARPLESAVLPQAADIAAAVLECF
jgi:pyruvate/2-oxoglutarate/acetoin dehydrogenase E1 component